MKANGRVSMKVRGMTEGASDREDMLTSPHCHGLLLLCSMRESEEARHTTTSPFSKYASGSAMSERVCLPVYKNWKSKHTKQVVHVHVREPLKMIT